MSCSKRIHVPKGVADLQKKTPTEQLVGFLFFNNHLGSAPSSFSHLVGLSPALRLAAASHDGVDVDVPVEARGRQHRGVPGAPLDVEAPMTAGGQLIQHLIQEDASLARGDRDNFHQSNLH